MVILKHCGYHGCRELVEVGRCPAHRGTETRAGRSRAHGTTGREWAELRQARLRLDEGLCQLRLEGCTTRATTVHLDPARRGQHRGATLTDVVSACAHCHGVIDGGRAGSL